MLRAGELASKRQTRPGRAPRSAIRFSHDDATQNYIEARRRRQERRSPRLVKGDLYAPYWWDVRIFKPGEVERGRDPLQARRRDRTASAGACRRRYVRDEATKALDPRRRARSREGARTRRVEDRPRALHAARAVAADAAKRARRSRVRLRARREARRRAHPAAPRRRRRRAHRDRALRPRPRNRSSDVSASCAARTMRSPARIASPPGCSTASAAASSARLWLCAHALARRATGRCVAGIVVGGLLAVGDSLAAPAARGSASTPRNRRATFWLRQVGARGRGRVGGGLGYALVFMTAESLHARAFPAHPQLWRLWSQGRGDRRARCWDARSAAICSFRFELALVAAFYYATQPLARLVATVRGADRSQHPVVRDAGADADRGVAAGGIHGGVPVPRGAALRSGALIGAALRPTAISGSRSRSSLQALVFGAAHANYPGFPSYSRLVELVVPSMLWAAIFLRFGLLADDPAARVVRPRAVLDPAISRRCAGRVGTARRGHRRGAGAAVRRPVAACAGGCVARAAVGALERRLDARPAAVAPHEVAGPARGSPRAWSCASNARCPCSAPWRAA